MAHISPIPGLALYNASKSLVNYFTQAVSFELQADKSNVDMMEYAPAMVYTKLSLRRGGFFTISAEVAAQESLDDLGNTSYTNGHWKHEVRFWMGSAMLYYLAPGAFKGMYEGNKKQFTNQQENHMK